MSQDIFVVDNVIEPEAKKLARGFIEGANQRFSRMVNEAYGDIERFWFRNSDEGKLVAYRPGKDDDVCTGPEILEALGTQAAALMGAAYAEVQMLVQLQISMGVDVIDMTRINVPYELEWNEDGSLKSAEIKEDYAKPEPKKPEASDDSEGESELDSGSE